MSPQLTIILVLSVSFSVFLVLGVPISVCIALSSFLALLPIYDPALAAQVIGHSFLSSLDNFGFLAIPFFVLAGQLMNAGGVARRLIEFAKVLSGPLPGSLAYCNVVANFLFGAVTGSAVASAAAVGSAMAPAQKEEGYDPAFAAAVNIASSTTGLLTPPSNSLILYALVSGGTSVIALFVAGYIPAFLMALAVVAVIAAKKDLPRGNMANWQGGRLIRAFVDAVPSLFLVVLVMGGLIAGVFTPTEASTVSVLYALFLGFLYRELKVRHLPRIFASAISTASIVLFLVATSAAMSWVFSIAEIPVFVSNTMLAFSQEPWVILLMMNLIMLVMGTFMDITPAILIFTPIFLPIATSIGVDPVHFGIIMVFNNCIGILTPPVGSSLFVGSGIYGVPLDKIMPRLMPMFWSECLALALITFIPELSLWLPRILGLLK
jgi:tripartite ATP-independent transporter DctM subunit